MKFAQTQYLIIQSFIQCRLRNLIFLLDAKVNDNIKEIAELPNPYQCQDLLVIEIFTNSFSHMDEAYK